MNKVLFAFLISFVSIKNVYALKFFDQQVILEKLDDYNLCQTRDSSGNFCHEALERWVDAHPADAFNAGKMTRLKMNAWGAVGFFHKAFSSKTGDCKDKDVQMAVLSAVALTDSYRDQISKANEIAFKFCPEELAEYVFDESEKSNQVFKNSCKELLKTKWLKGEVAKKCK